LLEFARQVVANSNALRKLLTGAQIGVCGLCIKVRPEEKLVREIIPEQSSLAELKGATPQGVSRISGRRALPH
jgi:hypothetical protein